MNDDTPAAPAADKPASPPPAAEPDRNPFLLLADAFGLKRGDIAALTAAEAKSAGENVRPAMPFELSLFGRQPLSPLA